MKKAKKYLDQAKKLKPVLIKGMEGLSELEKEEYSFWVMKKEILKMMLEELY